MTEPDIPSMVDHILTNRHRIPNRTALAFLAIARLNPAPTHRITWQQMSRTFGGLCRTGVTKQLQLMRRCGLIAYTAGTNDDPGYFINRIGPND